MFKIEIAGLSIAIDNKYEYIRRQCEKYIDERPPRMPDFTISISDDDTAAQAAELGWTPPPAFAENLCVYHKIIDRLPGYGAFLIHGTAIAVDNEGYVFLAKSGVGKSTHMMLWKKYFGDRAQIINGDKPIMLKTSDGWYVCPSPWRGKENLGGVTSFPLKALAFLERGKTNFVRSMNSTQVSELIFNQIILPKDEAGVTAAFSLLDDLLENIPFYLLTCNMDDGAAKIAYEGMQE